MVLLDSIKTELLTYETPLKEVGESLHLDINEKRIEELHMEMEAPNFWDDPDKANAHMKELKDLEGVRDDFKGLERQYEDILTLIEMGEDEEDGSYVSEVEQELNDFKEKFEEMRIANLLNEEYDKCNAILKLNAGAGGTESCDYV